MKLERYLQEFKTMAETYLIGKGFTLCQVKTGRDAWTVAHGSGIMRKAYDIGRDITDAHIQTALAEIMPNAEFKDKKRY